MKLQVHGRRSSGLKALAGCCDLLGSSVNDLPSNELKTLEKLLFFIFFWGSILMA